MSAFEKALAAIAPGLALRRQRQRMATAALGQMKSRRYEAAGRSRRTAGWQAAGTSANAEALAGGKRLRDLARDLERNNPWGHKALSVIVSNTIGTGIIGQPRGPKAKVQRAANLWRGWAETTACDFEGRHDLYGLQALVMQTVARDGEALIRKHRLSRGPVPIQLQVLEADLLDDGKMSTAGTTGNQILQGVETDADGRVVAYWLLPGHPGDPLAAVGASQRVDASDVIRVYRQERAGQLRGVSWFAPVMLTLRDLDEFEDAQLTRQKISACFTAFVHDATGAEPLDEDTPELGERVEPGIIEYLPAGKDITFASPPGVEGFDVTVRAYLRKVAAGLGVTYEALTGDLTSTNFSSGRLGFLEFQRNLEAWRWRMFIPQFCVPVWRAFVEASAVAGVDLAGVWSEWTPPRREMIDPAKEIAAMRESVRSGFGSLSEALRGLGYDPKAVMQEIADDAAELDRLGLILDSDPRKTAASGQAQKDASPKEGA